MRNWNSAVRILVAGSHLTPLFSCPPTWLRCSHKQLSPTTPFSASASFQSSLRTLLLPSLLTLPISLLILQLRLWCLLAVPQQASTPRRLYSSLLYKPRRLSLSDSGLLSRRSTRSRKSSLAHGQIPIDVVDTLATPPASVPAERSAPANGSVPLLKLLRLSPAFQT